MLSRKSCSMSEVVVVVHRERAGCGSTKSYLLQLPMESI